MTERMTGVADGLRGADETVEEKLADMLRERTDATPLGRVTETRDIANMAAFLSSNQSDHLTGLALSVSGGNVMT